MFFLIIQLASIVAGALIVYLLMLTMKLRALALKNANAIFKAFLTFQGLKTLASNNGKPHYCKNFCNNATVQF